MKKGWSGGKIAAAIAGGFVAFIILCIAFVASVYHLSEVLVKLSDKEYEEIAFWDWEKEQTDEDGFDEEDFDEEEDSDNEEDSDEEEDSEDEKEESRRKKRRSKEEEEPDDYEEEYYEFGNAIVDGLTYEVTFERYEREDFLPEGDGAFVMECKYPVVSGDVPNLEGINRAISAEKDLIEEHVTHVAEYLGMGEYEYLATAYVTYMSEEVLSVIYEEYVYLDGDFFESYIISVNIDMETGMVLKNDQLLAVDDKFSIEFRKRCEKQNGEIDSISYLSDQEITDYLTDEESLIVFYTPIGIEVGFNYYDGWVTVTYSEYQKYQQF